MDWLTIVKIILFALSAVVTVGIPAFLALKKAWKARLNAVTDVEKEKADADLLETAKNLIVAAEETYAGFDAILKQQNKSAGSMKKEAVFTQLQAYALQKAYEFDNDEWSAKIDKLVEFTKKVNKKA